MRAAVVALLLSRASPLATSPYPASRRAASRASSSSLASSQLPDDDFRDDDDEGEGADSAGGFYDGAVAGPDASSKRRRRRTLSVAPPLRAFKELGKDGSEYVKTINSEIWGGVTEGIEELDRRGRPLLRKIATGERDFVSRVHDGARELWQWSTFMARANAMGLTEDMDVTAQLKERVRHSYNVAKGDAEAHPSLLDDPRFQDDEYADAALRDDWAAIHLDTADDDETSFVDDDDDDDDADDDAESEAGGADYGALKATYEDVDVVSVDASEWEEIKTAAFEVDTQVIYDTVIKGKWTVRDGRTVFERDDDDDP